MFRVVVIRTSRKHQRRSALEIMVGMQGSATEFSPIAPGQVWPDINWINVSIRELETQMEADPSLALNKNLGIKRDWVDLDVGSALPIFGSLNSSLWEGFPQVLDGFFNFGFKCHGLIL